jgi:hypothetical protein
LPLCCAVRGYAGSSGCSLDGPDVPGLAGHGHDAVAFRLEVEAEPMRIAILCFDQPTFQTVKNRLRADIHDAFGGSHKNPQPEFAAPQQM